MIFHLFVNVRPEERIFDRIVEQFVQNPVSRCGQKIAEVAQIGPLEWVQHVQRRTVEQIVDVPVRQVLKEIVEVVRLASATTGRRACCGGSRASDLQEHVEVASLVLHESQFHKLLSSSVRVQGMHVCFVLSQIF